MAYFLISLFAAAADLMSKEAVKKYIPEGRKKQVKGRFWLWHIKNKGMAYNKFENRRKAVIGAAGAAVGLVFAYLLYLIKAGAKPVDKLGAALILGGGLGNLTERIKHGSVTDFLYIKAGKLPIFNVADVTAVTGGIITVVRAMFR